MKKLVLAIAVVMLGLFTNSCVEDNTTVSPSGIIPYTYNFTIYQNNWELSQEGNHWFYRLNVPHITEEVIDYGAVLVYFRNQYNSWVLLPFSTTYRLGETVTYTEEIWSSYFLYGVDIDYKYTHPNNATPPTELAIKVVVLKDNWSEGIYRKINVDDYKQLERTLERETK